MPQYQAPRGTQDILSEDQPWWDYVRQAAERLAAEYRYGAIETPMFEDASLFLRTVGEATDIVSKEMYLFKDRGDQQLALRPEGTAPVCRAYLEHGMTNLPQPVRLWYWMPNFRYDRPQAGRYREHHQFGVEAIGEDDPAIDAEIIEMLWRLYAELGLTGLTLHLNSIGDPVCRPKYLDALRAYYADKLDKVCQDCRARYEKNPLRLLDCKEERCQPVIAGAPKFTDYLCDACADHFARLRAYLDAVGIDVQPEPRPRPRPRLLHPHSVRGRAEGGGGTEQPRRRRALRRADRAAGREAHAGHRLRDGHRAHRPQPQAPGGRAARTEGPRPVRRLPGDRRQGTRVQVGVGRCGAPA